MPISPPPTSSRSTSTRKRRKIPTTRSTWAATTISACPAQRGTRKRSRPSPPPVIPAKAGIRLVLPEPLLRAFAPLRELNFFTRRREGTRSREEEQEGDSGLRRNDELGAQKLPCVAPPPSLHGAIPAPRRDRVRGRSSAGRAPQWHCGGQI